MSLARSRVKPSSLPAVRQRTRWVVGALAILVATHAYVLTLPWDHATPLVLASHLYAVVLLAGLLWLAAALGLRILRTLGLGRDLGLETLLFALGLGLGGLAYLALACGFLQVLNSWVLAAMLVVLAAILRPELTELTAAAPTLARAWLTQRREIRRERVLGLTVPIAEVLISLLVVRALAPPTGYDALLYHLAGPQEFLRAGRILPLAEMPGGTLPFTVEMLYLLGLALGSDELPGLLHLAFAGMTALATFGLGRRFFDARTGWMAAAIFLSATTIAVYGPMPNIDYGWAYFDFLAVCAFVTWTRDRQPAWLVVAGVASGLSLGSKFLGALTCMAIGLGLVGALARTLSSQPVRCATLLGWFGLPVVLVASPWYLKNLVWLGHPLWPLFGAGSMQSGWYFAHQMHHGRELIDYLVLPIRFFQGSSVEYSEAVPALLWVFVPGYLLVRKHRLVSGLLALAGLHLLIWSQGIQTLRYLFPIFPGLSLVAAYVLSRVAEWFRPRSVGPLAASSLVLVAMLPAPAVTMILMSMYTPFFQLAGVESRSTYLNRNLTAFGAVRYLNEHRTDVSRVLVLGDAHTFYLQSPSLVDQNLDTWSTLLPDGDPRDMTARLRQAGISHVLLSQRQFTWLERFDPERRVRQWWALFQHTQPSYLQPVFSYTGVTVYRVVELADEAT